MASGKVIHAFQEGKNSCTRKRGCVAARAGRLGLDPYHCKGKHNKRKFWKLKLTTIKKNKTKQTKTHSLFWTELLQEAPKRRPN